MSKRSGKGKAVGCGAAKRQSNQESWASYSYSLNDPVNHTDPLGLWPCGAALYGGFAWSEISFVASSHINPLADFLACNPIRLMAAPLDFFEPACKCTGTDCSFYKRMCKLAAGKTDAAVAYYCVAARLVCRFAGQSCVLNCIRQSLQDLDVAAGCINRPTNDTFTACQVSIHAAAFSLCNSELCAP